MTPTGLQSFRGPEDVLLILPQGCIFKHGVERLMKFVSTSLTLNIYPTVRLCYYPLYCQCFGLQSGNILTVMVITVSSSQITPYLRFPSSQHCTATAITRYLWLQYGCDGISVRAKLPSVCVLLHKSLQLTEALIYFGQHLVWRSSPNSENIEQVVISSVLPILPKST